MADFSEQELANITQAVARDIREFGQVTAATADRLRDASVGIEGFSRSVRSAKDQVGTAMQNFASATYRGTGAMDQYNSTVNSLGQASSTLLSMFGPLGVAAGGLVRVFTELYGVSTKQLTQNYETFKKLNQSGLFLGAELNDLIESGKAFGMSVASNTDHQRSFIDILSRNSKVLAQFGKGTDGGRQKLEQLSIAMEGQRAGLLALGFSYEEIMEGQANYIKLQTEAGNKVTGNADEQAKAASRYLRELRGLAEITGESVKEQQAAREELLANQRFQAKLDEMRANGQDKEAENLIATYTILRSQSKEMAKGFADVSTGNLASKEAQKLQLSTQGQALKASQDLANGTATAGQAINAIAEGADRQAQSIRGYVKATGNETGTFNNYVEMKKVAQLKERDLDREMLEAEAKDVAMRKKLNDENKQLLADIQKLPRGSAERAAAEAQLAKNQQQLMSGIDTEITGRKAAIRTAEQIDRGLATETIAVTGALNKFKNALLDVTDMLLRLVGRGAPAASSAAPTGTTGAAAPGGGAARTATPAGTTGGGAAAPSAAASAPMALTSQTQDALNKLQQQFPGIRITSTTGGQHTPGSAHYQGRAFDIGLRGVSDRQKAEIMAYLQGLNPKRVDDESTRPSGPSGRYWSGPHIHAQFETGGIARGPRSGYLAELHGTEAVVPLPDGKSIPVKNNDNSELTQVMRDLKTSLSGGNVGGKEVITLLQSMLSAQREQNSTLGKILQNARA